MTGDVTGGEVGERRGTANDGGGGNDDRAAVGGCGSRRVSGRGEGR